MLTSRRIIFVLLLLVALVSTAMAQGGVEQAAQKSSLAITAAAFGERVRIAVGAERSAKVIRGG